MSVVTFKRNRLRPPASPLRGRPGSRLPDGLLLKLDEVTDSAPHLLAAIEQITDAALASAGQDTADSEREFHARITSFVRDIVRLRCQKAEWLLHLTEDFMARAFERMGGA